jgi:hypothetical protein
MEAMTDARARWKEEHRRRRVRSRWLDPLKRRLSLALFVAAAACLVLAAVVDINWMAGFFVTCFGGLFLRGYTLGEIFSHGGSTDGYVGDGGGDHGGGDGG